MHTYEVTVYTGPSCQRCTFVKRKLTKEGIPYEERPAHTLENHTYLKSLGYQGIPITTVRRDGQLWTHWMGADVDAMGDVIAAIKANEEAAA